MLQRCADELVNLAPTADETRHALKLLESRCPPWRFWLGWIALAGAVLATAGHALARSLRRHRGMTPIALTLAAVAFLVSSNPGPAFADSQMPARARLGKWPLNEDDPESSIPKIDDINKDPLEFGYWLQDVALDADVYFNHKEYEKAAKFYRALAKAVPDRAISFTKLCDCYEAMGDTRMAIASCGTALLLEGVRQRDYEHYVRLVVMQTGAISDRDQTTLQGVILHLKDDPAAHPLADQLECLAGRRLGDRAMLRECTKVLASQAPNDLATIEAEFALATLDHDFGHARELIAAAEKAGAKKEVVSLMSRAVIDTGIHRFLGWILVGVAAAFSAVTLILVGYFVRQRRAGQGEASSGPPLIEPPVEPQAEKA
jgi:hypothetical protein